jgi:hypothetical protein
MNHRLKARPEFLRTFAVQKSVHNGMTFSTASRAIPDILEFHNNPVPDDRFTHEVAKALGMVEHT